MACRSCKSALELLPRRSMAFRRAHADKNLSAACFAPQGAPATSSPFRSNRRMHSSPQYRETEQERMGLRMRLFRPMAERMAKVAPGVAEPYRVWGQTKEMYNICASQADYAISEKDRKEDKIVTLEDGEEVGTGESMWYSGERAPSFLLLRYSVVPLSLTRAIHPALPAAHRINADLISLQTSISSPPSAHGRR